MYIYIRLYIYIIYIYIYIYNISKQCRDDLYGINPTS